jgi:hypothetical protein
MFLSPKQPGVYEVQIDLDTEDSICSCPTFRVRKTCRHVKFVNARIESNDGHYPLMVNERAEMVAAGEALKNPEAFRDFVIKYGKIEVL